MECMENVETQKSNTVFKDFMALNVHRNANRKSSSNSGHLDWKSREIRVFQSFSLLCDVNMMLKMEPATFSIQNRDKRTSERMVNHPFFCYNDTKRIVYIMEELLDWMEYIEDVRQTRKVRHKLSEKGDFKEALIKAGKSQANKRR